MSSDLEIVNSIRTGDIKTFEKLYYSYYGVLCVIAESYLRKKELAEEVVSDVFCNMWDKREHINITVSVKAYLMRAVQNGCINYLEHLRIKQRVEDKLIAESSEYVIPWSDDYPLERLFQKELLNNIKNAVDSLPDQCRTIFLLSRDEELNYEAIARQLDISLNTVKTQMKIALRKLREKLKDYLPVVWALLHLLG